MHGCLEDLLYIVEECDLTLKLEVLNAVFSAVRHTKRDIVFIECLDKFASYLEQLIYEIINNKFELTTNDRILFESVLTTFNGCLFYSNDNSRKIRICEFILTKPYTQLQLSQKIIADCIVFIRNSNELSRDTDTIITNVFANNKVELFCTIERELKMKSTTRDVIWRKVIDTLIQNWRRSNCKTGCTLTIQLQIFGEIANMALRLRLNSVIPECLEEFTKCCNNHFTICTTRMAPELFLNAVVNCGLFCTTQNLQPLSRLILHPLGLVPADMQMCNFKRYYTFLSSQKPDTIYILQSFNKFLSIFLLRNLEEVYFLRNDFLRYLKEITKDVSSEAAAGVVSCFCYNFSQFTFCCVVYSKIMFDVSL